MREERIPNPGHLLYGWSVIIATYVAPLIFKCLARLVFRQNMDVFGAMWMESSNVYGDHVIRQTAANPEDKDGSVQVSNGSP